MARYFIRLYDANVRTYYVERIVEVDDITEIPEKLQHDWAFMDNIHKTFTTQKDLSTLWFSNPKTIIPL